MYVANTVVDPGDKSVIQTENFCSDRACIPSWTYVSICRTISFKKKKTGL